MALGLDSIRIRLRQGYGGTGQQPSGWQIDAGVISQWFFVGLAQV